VHKKGAGEAGGERREAPKLTGFSGTYFLCAVAVAATAAAASNCSSEGLKMGWKDGK